MEYKNAVIIAAAAATMFSACGGAETPEAKKELLAKKKTELATLQAEVKKMETELGGAAKPEARTLRNVETEETKAEAFAHFFEVQGNVETDGSIMVRPELAGILKSRKVKEGQIVSKGQVIAEIDIETINKSLAEMDKRLELAVAVFERQKNLWDQKIGSEIQFLQAQNNKEALEKSIETLKTQKQKAIITAPISGTLEEFYVNEGETVAPGMPIAMILNISSVKVVAEISETYSLGIKRGHSVDLAFPALGMTKKVSVTKVGQMINPANRTFPIEMEIPNGGGDIKPNTMAVVSIRDFERQNAVTVPGNLIQRSTSGENFIYVAEAKDGKTYAKRLVVKPGISYKGRTLIEEGLQAGARVIIKGYSEVYDGEEINKL